MRKTISILGLAAISILVWAQGSGADVLNSFVKALNSAQSLSVTYTLQVIGGAPMTYSVEMAKPNLVKIDRPNEQIVADGKTVTTYDKETKTYYKRAQTDQDIKELLTPVEVELWRGFFDGKAFDKLTSKNLGSTSRGGKTYNAVEVRMDPAGRKIFTIYLDPSDNVARQATIVLNNDDVKESAVITTRSLELGTDVKADLFAFKAPAGSRELTEEELNANKWFTNLDEALATAARTKRLVMIDFFTEW